MADADNQGLREPLARPLSRPLVSTDCAACLFGGPEVVLNHPWAVQIVLAFGGTALAVFTRMDQVWCDTAVVVFTIFTLVMMFILKRVCDRMISLEDPCSWGHVSHIADADLFQNMATHFARACDNYQNMYPVQLAVLDAWTVNDPHAEEAFRNVQRDLASEDPNVRALYHGTSAFAVKQIVANGFRLPHRAGMFGKGLYFSDTPLKSWQYSSVGFVFLCDVALGIEKRTLRGDRSLSLDSLRDRASQLFEYDSVAGGTAAQGGTLRLPEWVVYRPAQAIPRTLLRVCRTGQEDAIRANLARDLCLFRTIVQLLFGFLLGAGFCFLCFVAALSVGQFVDWFQ